MNALATALRRRLASQDGFVVATAIIVMSLMLLTGVAILKIVNTQSKSSGTERVRESAFNLGEGFLYAQSSVLQNNWPRNPPATGNPGGAGYVDQCAWNTVGTNPANQCPTLAQLLGSSAAFNNVDIQKPNVANNLEWFVQVRDDQGVNPNVYNASEVDTACSGAPCTYDKNKNRKMWVRVDIRVPGARRKDRSLVALLQLENVNLPFPTAAVAGGTVTASNSGNKTVIETGGTTSVVTRCVPTPTTVTTGAFTSNIPALNRSTVTVANSANFVVGRKYAIDTGTSYEIMELQAVTLGAPGILVFTTNPANSHAASNVQIQIAPGETGNTCENWDWTKNQVSPIQNYTSNPNFSNGLTQTQFDLLKKSQFTATYDNACPDNNDPTSWTGNILIIHTPAAGCLMNPTGINNINSASSYGFIVVQNGSLNFQANDNYWGVIYMRNEQGWGPPPDAPVFQISGNATVHGGVAVDGQGQVIIGQSSGTDPSVIFDPNAFLTFGAAGAAGLVQNTWREL